MTVVQRSFLPDSLRPQPKVAPRSRRGFRIRLGLGLAAFAAGVWLVTSWQISDVSVQTCQGMPPSAARDLELLKGNWVPAVDLRWVRRQAEQWPGVGAVDVELRLPGTLSVRAVAEEICGSIPVGRGWRAVSCEGHPGRRLGNAQMPVLIGFGNDEAQLRRGLAVGRRVAGARQEGVLSIRRVAPLDLEVRLDSDFAEGEPVTVRVLPDGSPGEAWWHEERTRGTAPRWADLRFGDRVVVGGLG
jgi:hypothetical protein